MTWGEKKRRILRHYELNPQALNTAIARASGCTEEYVGMVLEAYGFRRRRKYDPDRNAQILSLIWQGFTYGEVARAMNVSRGIVAGVVHRNRELLSGHLPPAEPIGDTVGACR